MTEENLAAIDQVSEDEETDDDAPIVEWSHEQLRKRSQELQLVDENGKFIVSVLDNRRNANEPNERTHLAVDDGFTGELDDGSKSASTTSDSQVCIFLFLKLKVRLIQ